MPRRIIFPEAGAVELDFFDPEPLRPGSIRIATRWSLMSTGTENIALNGLFTVGTHWADYARYPFQPGYAAVGVVTETAADVTSPEVGTVVFALVPHASEHVVDADLAIPVGDGISEEDATWGALAAVAFVGTRRAGVHVGDSVLVIGAGPVGQMAVRWAAATGAGAIAALDPAAGRLELARDGGASAQIALPVADARSAVEEAFGGIRPRVVVEATGRAATLAEALPLVADFGTLVLVGDTGSPGAQHLTTDVITRGLSIVGAHLNHLPVVLGLITAESDAARVPMSKETITNAAHRQHGRAFFDLVRRKRFRLDGLISHTFLAAAAVDAYNLANARRQDTMGILFDWNS